MLPRATLADGVYEIRDRVEDLRVCRRIDSMRVWLGYSTHQAKMNKGRAVLEVA